MFQIPALSDEYRFEDLITDLFNAIEKTTTYQKFGVKGQSQKGIDNFSGSIKNRTVIQCKKKDINRSDSKIKKQLKIDLDNSLESAKNLEFEFERFILASTFKNDNYLQEIALKKSDENNQQIEYWGWNTISEHLLDNKDILYKYYPDFNLSLSIPSNSLVPFREKDSFKILVLPFNTYGEGKKGDMETALFNYYRSLENRKDLEIRIKRTNGEAISETEAKKIRIDEKVNMVIFGSYESNLTEKAVIIKYNANLLDEEINSSSKYDFRQLLDIEGGYLPLDLHYMTHFTLGFQAYLNEDYDKAISEFYKLITGFELVDFHILIYTADSFLRKEDIKNAKIFFEHALKYEPEFEYIYFQLGTINYKQKNYSEALKIYEKGLSINEKQPDLLYYYGETLVELGRNNLGKEYLIKSINEDNENLSAYYSLSRLLLIEENFEESEKYARIIIDKDPEDFEAHNLLGNIYGKLQSYELAIHHLKKCININPDFGEGYNNLGLTYNAIGEDQATEKNYLISIKLTPNLATTYCNYGHFLFDKERYEEAINNLNKANELKKGYYRAYNLLGIIYNIKEDFDKSLNNYVLAHIYGSELAMNNINRLFERYGIPNFLQKALDFIPKMEGEQLDLFVKQYLETMNKIKK